MTRRAAAVLASFALGGAGCLSSPSARHADPTAAWLTPPNPAASPPAPRPAPAAMTDAAVVPVAFTELQPEVAPPPRSADTDTKIDPDLKANPDSKAGTDGKPGAVPPGPPMASPSVTGSPRSVGGPLSLEEVLTSVERSFPLLRSIEQERAIAGGRLLSSMGAFDLNLFASAEGQGTTYDNVRSSAGVSQGLPVGGLGVFAGYRNGVGDFPTYNLGQKTADGGEFRAGLSIPLLRDREIDRPRAAIQQARIDVAIAEPVIERQRLDFERAAARTYWGWVAAGVRLKVAESLVRLAADRDEQLKERVEVGATANIERVDNQQNIALRNGILVQVERAFQKATIDLSLFLRDGSGSPTLAGTDRLPSFPEVRPIDMAAFPAFLQAALQARPEPRRLRLTRDKTAVDLRLADNQTLPSLNAVVAASQDVGFGKSSLSGPNGSDRTGVSAGVAFQLPVQRRDALGKVMAAQARLVQIEFQLRQAEDVVRADVQDTFSALERAFEFYQQAKNRVELARLVARAERERLRLGRSDILRVTLREQAAFDAEVSEIGAQLDYFRAAADFRAAIGGR